MDWGFILSNTATWLIAPETIAYAIATVGLAVHFGYGLLNFGQAGFMAIGAYGYAISILSFNLPWWVGILVGLVASVVFALILGLPTLRLRADYLAIVTIAAAEVVRLLFNSTVFDEYTNSADGLGGYHEGFRAANPIPPGTYGFGPFRFNEQDWWIRLFGIAILILAILVVWLLMRSPWGRVVKGIREDEDAVRALGKNVFSFKMQVLILGGCLGALPGQLRRARGMRPVEDQTGQRHPVGRQPVHEVRRLTQRVLGRRRDHHEGRLGPAQQFVGSLGTFPEATEHGVQRPDERRDVHQQLSADDPGQYPTEQ